MRRNKRCCQRPQTATGRKRDLDAFKEDYHVAFSQYVPYTQPIYQESINGASRKRTKKDLPYTLLKAKMAGLSLDETPLFDEEALQRHIALVAKGASKLSKKVRLSVPCESSSDSNKHNRDTPSRLPRPVLIPVTRLPRHLRTAVVHAPDSQKPQQVDGASVQRSLNKRAYLQSRGLAMSDGSAYLYGDIDMTDADDKEAVQQRKRTKAVHVTSEWRFAELGPSLPVPRLGHFGTQPCDRCGRIRPGWALVSQRARWHNANNTVRVCAACASRGLGVRPRPRPRICLDTINPSPSAPVAAPVAAPVSGQASDSVSVSTTPATNKRKRSSSDTSTSSNSSDSSSRSSSSSLSSASGSVSGTSSVTSVSSITSASSTSPSRLVSDEYRQHPIPKETQPVTEPQPKLEAAKFQPPPQTRPVQASASEVLAKPSPKKSVRLNRRIMRNDPTRFFGLY